MELVYAKAAGIDISKSDAVMCVRTAGPKGQADRQITDWGARTCDILDLAAYLKDEQVERVVLEATSSYWKPFFFLLQEEGLDVVLANPQQVRAIPGRKSDVQDSEWLADLAAHGLIKPSFVQALPTRELKDLMRRRVRLTQTRTQEVQRVEKVLESCGVKLAGKGGLTDIMGVSGRAMLAAMAKGPYDPAQVAELADPRVKASHADLTQALTGGMGEHHRFMLASCLSVIDLFDVQIAHMEERIGSYFDPEDPGCGSQNADPAWRADMAAKRELLQTIPGVKAVTAERILAEAGPDLSTFPTAGHFAAWAGVVPGQNQSAGKKKSAKTRRGNTHLKGALGTAAMAAARDKKTFLHARHKRLISSKGYMKALVATERKIAEAVWYCLTTGEPYVELGSDYYAKRKPGNALRSGLNRCTQAGYTVEAVGDGVYIVTAPQAA